MVELVRISPEELEQRVSAAGLELPIEQSAAWQAYQQTIEGRSFWGAFEIVADGQPAGYAAFTDYLTHGYHYLRSNHAPIWIEQPGPERERELVKGLVRAVRGIDPKIAFIRCSVDAELPETRKTLSMIPYDTTVVIDLAGDEEELFSRMKPRGRRDVRKALRECDASFADETDRALEDFDEYYRVFVDTAQRDGFHPQPASDYTGLLEALAPEHARLFAARIDGKPVSWSIVTISGTLAMRYYGASSSDAGRRHATDALVFHECRMLAELGCTAYDLMAIGSDFCPSLKGLNEFKTKFSKETVHVAPDRDIPVRKGLYAALSALKALRANVHRLRKAR